MISKPPPVRRFISIVCTCLLSLVLSAANSGCATHVFPPASPPNPTRVYLCDYGFHSSLLMPTGNGLFVEYVYGDWPYAAMNKTDPMHTLGALLFSFQPALGRRFLAPLPGEEYPNPPNRPNSITPIVVDGEKVKATLDTLNVRFEKHVDTALFNDAPDYDYMFVKDDEHYSVIHSCNHLTVRNLCSMGCTIGGFPIFSNFLVEPPGGPFPLNARRRRWGGDDAII